MERLFGLQGCDMMDLLEIETAKVQQDRNEHADPRSVPSEIEADAYDCARRMRARGMHPKTPRFGNAGDRLSPLHAARMDKHTFRITFQHPRAELDAHATSDGDVPSAGFPRQSVEPLFGT